MRLLRGGRGCCSATVRGGGRGCSAARAGGAAAGGAALRRAGAAARSPRRLRLRLGRRNFCGAADSAFAGRKGLLRGCCGRDFCAARRGGRGCGKADGASALRTVALMIPRGCSMLMLWFQVDLTCDPGNHAVCKARRTDESDDKKVVALDNHGTSSTTTRNKKWQAASCLIMLGMM